MADSAPELTPRDIEMVLDHVRLNPPDGTVRFEVDERGEWLAKWTSEGRPASVGPVIDPLSD